MAKPAAPPVYKPLVYKFGEFEADAARLELRRGGAPLPIQAKPLQLLFYLLENRDRALSKAELLDHVWPDVSVGEAALTSAIRDLRRALVSDPRSGLIRNLHGRGYRLDDAVPVEVGSAHAPVDRGAPHAATTGARLYEREVELAALRGALDRARRSEGQVRLISGPAGIGKSALLLALARDAKALRVRTVMASCSEDMTAAHLSIWIETARALLDGLDPPARARWADSPLAARAPELFPDATAVAPAGLNAAQELIRVRDSIEGILRAAACDGALVLCFDDLQWSDETSLRVLRSLIPRIVDLPVLVLGTIRELAGDPQREVGRFSAAVASGAHCEKMVLSELSQTAVAALLAASSASPLPDSEVRGIYEATHGNPFFVSEIARSLGSPRATRQAVGEASGVPLSAQVRDVVGESIARCSDACRELLVLAACAGIEFDVSVLRVAAARPGRTVLDRLDEAERHGFVQAIADAPGRYRFAHALVRDALYASVTSSERTILHQRVGRALAHLYEDDPLPPVLELARHFGIAAPAGSAATALSYARAAAADCAARWAWSDAERNARIALHSMGYLESKDRRLHCALLIEHADLLTKSRIELGEAVPSEALSELDQAIELARHIGAPELFASAVAHRTEHELSIRVPITESPFDKELAATLDRALEEAIAAHGDELTEARVRATLQLGRLCFQRAQPLRGQRLCEEAATLARRLRLDEQLALAQFSLWERMGPSSNDVREGISREIDAVTSGAPQLTYYRSHAAFCKAVHALEYADLARAERAMRDFADVFVEIGLPTEIPYIFRCMVGALRGDFDDASAQLANVSRLHVELGYTRDRSALAESALWLGLLCAQGRAADVLPATRVAATTMGSPVAWLMYAYALIQCEMRDPLREAYPRIARDDGLDDNHWLVSWMLRGEAAVLLGDRAEIERAYAILLPYAEWAAMMGWIAVGFGAVARVLGRLAAALEEPEAARGHFELALRVNQRLGARPFTARTQIDYASWLERGDRDARSRARALRVEARNTASELGISDLVERATAGL